MREVLPSARLRRRYLVVVAGDTRQARRMTAGIRGVASLAAISDTSLREEGAAQRVTHVSSQRLLVVWPAFAPLGPDGRRRVVAHELTHASLAGVTSGRTPSWLVEGVAMYVSGDRRADEAASLERRPRPRAPPAARSPCPPCRSRARSPASAATARPPPTPTAPRRRSTSPSASATRRLFRLYDAFNRESLTGKPGPSSPTRPCGARSGSRSRELDRGSARRP